MKINRQKWTVLAPIICFFVVFIWMQLDGGKQKVVHPFSPKKEVRAIIYASTTADQDTLNNGVGFIVYIHPGGTTSTIQTDGLELGGIAQNEEGHVFTVDKDHLLVIDDAIHSFPMDQTQHTGEYVGYITSNQMFYAIFNTGFTKGRTYASDIYWTNGTDLFDDSIEGYVLATGHDDTSLYVLISMSEDITDVSLLNIHLDKDMNVEQLDTWKIAVDDLIISNVIVDDPYIYYVQMQQAKDKRYFSQTVLIKRNMRTSHEEVYVIEGVQTSSDFTNQLPFNSRNALFEVGDDLYYVNGLGIVYHIQKEKGKIREHFQFSGYEKESMNVSYGEQVAVTDDRLAFVYYNWEEDSYQLDIYDLQSGERLEQQLIEGIEEEFDQLGNMYAPTYDFIFIK